MIDENKYQEDIQKEFDRMTSDEKEPIKDLGKVNLTKNSNKEIIENDLEIKRLNDTMGYYSIDLNLLPSKGKFYQDNFRIMIRACRVTEIREFSSVDERNLIDVIDKTNYILQNCTQVYSGKIKTSYKDILQMDKLYLLLMIRELTFTTAKLQLPITPSMCPTYNCTPQSSIEFRLNEVKIETKSDETLDKYYNDEKRCYSFITKSYGTIDMYCPTIGVQTAVANWQAKQLQDNKNYDKSLISMIMFFSRDWRLLSDKTIFSTATEFESWDVNKFSLIFNLAQKIDSCSEPELITKCKTCGEDMRIPLGFQWKSFRELIIPDVSDTGLETELV